MIAGALLPARFCAEDSSITFTAITVTAKGQPHADPDGDAQIGSNDPAELPKRLPDNRASVYIIEMTVKKEKLPMANSRHEMILKLISEQEVPTQEALRDLLREQGIQVTQATISRDIRILGLRKRRSATGVNHYIRGGIAATAPISLLKDVVIKIDHAINTVVLRCHPGSAQAACVVLDRMQLPEIVGTIAGDDTIFILTRSEEQAEAMIRLLKSQIWG